jgi:hypothetical protein
MTTRIRLAIIATALGAASALFIATPGAIATQGQPVLAGVQNTETSQTVLANTKWVSLNDCAAVNSTFASGFVACGIRGVEGLGTGVGVRGEGDTGVVGSGSDRGVLGSSPIHGVEGNGFTSGKGVFGQSSTGTGVFGETTGDSGIGVQGLTHGVGSAVFGEATGNGVGVFGKSDTSIALQGNSAQGTALQVNGKAKFSRSKTVTVSAGTTSKTVSLAGVTTSSMVLATAQQNASVFVKAAVPAAGSFTIYLNGNAPAGGLKVAYFVLN